MTLTNIQQQKGGHTYRQRLGVVDVNLPANWQHAAFWCSRSCFRLVVIAVRLRFVGGFRGTMPVFAVYILSLPKATNSLNSLYIDSVVRPYTIQKRARHSVQMCYTRSRTMVKPLCASTTTSLATAWFFGVRMGCLALGASVVGRKVISKAQASRPFEITHRCHCSSFMSVTLLFLH